MVDGDDVLLGSFADALVSRLQLLHDFAAADAVQKQAHSWTEVQRLAPGFVRTKLNDLLQALHDFQAELPELAGKQVSCPGLRSFQGWWSQRFRTCFNLTSSCTATSPSLCTPPAAVRDPLYLRPRHT